MSTAPSNIPEPKMLPAGSASPSSPAPQPASASQPAPATVEVLPARTPARQLHELPKDELKTLAEEFGLDPSRLQTPQHLVAAVHERRQLIASMDREAMLDVIKWARRPVPLNASKEQLAQEIVRIRSMRFNGLSQRGLLALGKLRSVSISESDAVPVLIKKLKKQEGFFTRLNRRRRSMLGSLVSSIIGEDEKSSDYQFLPPQDADAEAPKAVPPSRPATIKEEIEESGLFGGIAGRIKKSADSYVNQKLDEIEARIDRKLDEIDRRLGEWRDKEIANRIRILKITLWASVIVGVVSLLYSYIVHLINLWRS
ncbi:MAG TPA: hypothetical protein VGQ99_20975 [Tepidisphaeraceae bacterium]|nr:hypothetical protein [Tepidisphaeraceae bacterium]